MKHIKTLTQEETAEIDAQTIRNDALFGYSVKHPVKGELLLSLSCGDFKEQYVKGFVYRMLGKSPSMEMARIIGEDERFDETRVVGRDGNVGSDGRYPSDWEM
ncbi:MAG: hypothetical protein AABX03_03330 [Nanoarchaeota archaeon]